MKKFINNLTNLPVAVSGLALGTAGIGNVLALEIDNRLRYLCAAIATLLLAMVLIKKLLHPRLLLDEIAHPVLGSFVPAFDMALMVLADILVPFSLELAQTLWYSAIILHLIFASSFIYRRLKDFNLNHMLPSWYVPPVGIVVACVTGNSMHAAQLTHLIFYFGLALYLLMLPIMMYRLIFGERISDAQLPSFGVMGAPASLCLAGYLNAFSTPNPQLVGMLLALALMMTSLVYISFARINSFRIAFIPIYASFTFPMAIGSTALLKYARYLGLGSTAGQFWHLIGLLEMCAAVVTIAWVLLRMSQHISQQVIFSD